MSSIEHNYDFYDFSLSYNFTKIAIIRYSRNFRKIRSSRRAFSATSLANIHLPTNLTKISNENCDFSQFS